MRCKYIRKIFQNEENGYTVALFSTLNQEVPLSARDKFWAEKKIIAFTAKGYDLPLTDEIEIEMEGEWETSSYGTQYKVETFLEVVPRTREGILGYLSCGSLKGIGPKTAERIVNRFGLDTLEVMEKYPQELLKIQGISQQKLDRIVDSFGKNKVFRELMTFLSPFHVTPKKANMILQKFRDQSVEIIRKQPYILCAVKGFGFLTVDAIARQCCAATNDPMRISGCVSYVLREAMKQNGHLYLEQEILVKDALKVLNKEPDLQPVTETEILKVIYRLVMQDSIVVEENRIYITKQYQEEEDTASMIARKLYERIPVLTIEKELEEAQKDLNITLSEQQKEAVRMVFANPISIITGGPGTGKTTVLKVILYIYQKKCGNKVQLMAPTGRAARRMAESTGSGDATTMHMALGLGRALADAGYGLQFADVGEGNDPMQVDAGIPVNQGTSMQAAMPAQNPAPAMQQTPNQPAGAMPAFQTQAMPGQQMMEQFYQEAQANGNTISRATGSGQMTNPVMSSASGGVAPTMQQIPHQQQMPSKPQSLAPNMPVEELVKWMSYEQAIQVAITGKGKFSGKTMGQVAMESPSSLQWFAEQYHGQNHFIPAAARVILAKA